MDRADHEHIQVSVQSEEDTSVVNFNRDRGWKIRVTQLPCGCSKFEKEQPKAPQGCLMYYPGVVAGKIKSFNYDHVGCYRYNFTSDQTIFNPYIQTHTTSIKLGKTVMS